MPDHERATVGLLDYITAHSLDEDYEHVAAQRHAVEGRRGGRGSGLAAMVVLGLFGLLLTTAALQTARSEPIQQRSQESLVEQVNARRAELEAAREEVAQLQRAATRAQAQALDATETGRALDEQLARLGGATGADAVTGPGLRVTVDDAPDGTEVVLDQDLQILVNGLWASGAEAISINGQRLTGLSSIRIAGEAITVNLRSVPRPYVVSAIGDPDQLAARFVESDGGTWWLNLKAVYDLRFTMKTEDSLTLPAAPALELRHARPAQSSKPAKEQPEGSAR